MKKKYKPWLKALSAVSGNLSAAWFAASLVGFQATFPQTLKDFIFLTVNILLGMLFLLSTVFFERHLQK